MPAKPKTYPRLRREATALDTPAARLVTLSSHPSITVSRWAQANPSLPTERLAELLRCGKPAAWDNPSAWAALMTMPREEVEAGAFQCVCEVAIGRAQPNRFGPEDVPYPVSDGMRSLLGGPLLSGWERATTPDILRMATTYAVSCGNLSRQHHASTLIGCLAVRSVKWVDASCWKAELDFAESLAWSGRSDSRATSKMLDVAGRLGHLAMHAVAFLPGWHERVGFNRERPDVANFLRWVVPTPPWLEVLDG